MVAYNGAKTVTEIPIIDIAGAFSPSLSARRAVAQELRKSAMDIGFFYIVNHGVPEELIAAQFEMTRRFFDLPEADKLAVHIDQSSCMRGYEPLGAQTLDSDSPPDLKESFLLSRDLAPNHPFVVEGIANYGPNQWPALPGFREQMERYYAALSALELTMMRSLALSLDLPEDYFDAIYDEPSSIIRLAYYPPQEGTIRNNQIGAGAHTDWGMLTFLLQDDVGGLEVLRADGEWIRATPIPGSFVVNIGDMITRMTNGLYHSTMHRVANNGTGRRRYSVPFFGEPNLKAGISVLDTCISPDRPARFAPCTAGEHLYEMQMKTFGKSEAA